VDAQTAEALEPASYTDSSDGHAGPGHSDVLYVKIFLFLVVLTAAEVTLTYLHIGKFFIPILMVLMVVKFLTVVSVFMHLRFETAKIFGRLFYTGLFTAVVVFIGMLTTFRIWSA
jgi:cytochrome c oxidase subunit IV